MIKRGYGHITSSEQAGDHCLLFVGAIVSYPLYNYHTLSIVMVIDEYTNEQNREPITVVSTVGLRKNECTIVNTAGVMRVIILRLFFYHVSVVL